MKPLQGREGQRSKWKPPCASCGAPSSKVIVTGPVGGITLPPFPVCRHCDGVYRSCRTKEAEERFILEMASETLRRLRAAY